MIWVSVEPHVWNKEEGEWQEPEGAIGHINLRCKKQGIFSLFLWDRKPKQHSLSLVLGDGSTDFYLTGKQAEALGRLVGGSWNPLAGFVYNLWNYLTLQRDPHGLDHPKGIMPTSKGRMELWLGDKLWYSERLRPGKSPEWVGVKDQLGRQLKEVEEKSFAGKVLGGLERQFRVPAKVLLPPGCSIEAVTPKSDRYDDFNRSDHALVGGGNATYGGNDQGWTWVDTHNVTDPAIASNRISWELSTAQNGVSCANTALSSTNLWAYIYVDAFINGTSGSGGVTVRMQDSATRTYYAGEVISGTYKLYLRTYVAGSLADSQANTSTTIQPPCPITLYADGSSIRVSNGTHTKTITDTTIDTGYYTGIGCRSGGVYMDNFHSWDDVTYVPIDPGSMFSEGAW